MIFRMRDGNRSQSLLTTPLILKIQLRGHNTLEKQYVRSVETCTAARHAGLHAMLKSLLSFYGIYALARAGVPRDRNEREPRVSYADPLARMLPLEGR